MGPFFLLDQNQKTKYDHVAENIDIQLYTYASLVDKPTLETTLSVLDLRIVYINN